MSAIFTLTQKSETDVIREILGLAQEDDANWMIIDSESMKTTGGEMKLRMVGLTDQKDYETGNRLGWMRGLIVDLTENVVVCSSLGGSPLIVTDHLTPDANGDLVLTDLDGATVLVAEPVILRGEEGAIVRTYKYKGMNFFSTYKNIRAENCFWGDKKTYDLWIESGGEDYTKFDSLLETSTNIHFWMLTHKNMWLCNKWRKKSEVVLIAIKNVPRGIDDAKDITEIPDPGLDIDTANFHLRGGELFDPSTNTENVFVPEFAVLLTDEKTSLQNFFVGEFLLVFDNTGKMYRIEHPGYHWRQAMCNQNPNVVRQLYIASELSFSRASSFHQFIPFLQGFSDGNLQKALAEGPLVHWPGQVGLSDESQQPHEPSLRAVHKAFLMAVTFSKQQLVLDAISTYRHDTKMVFTKLMDMTYPVSSTPFVAKRITQLRTVAGTSKRLSYEENLKNLLEKEYGTSMYNLVGWATGKW